MATSGSPFAVAFHQAAQVQREQLYGVREDPQLPLNLHADARVPFLGFCGPSYREGGAVLLGINPGGGGEGYQVRTPQDQELIPLIERFVASGQDDVADAFAAMCASYSAQLQAWNLWKIVAPILDACGTGIDAVCYLNLFPYRTARDAKPSATALRKAQRMVTEPLLDALRPSMLVALGKKAGNTAVSFPPCGSGCRLHVVPRTRGDTYVCEEALAVLEDIRSRRVQPPR